MSKEIEQFDAEKRKIYLAELNCMQSIVANILDRDNSMKVYPREKGLSRFIDMLLSDNLVVMREYDSRSDVRAQTYVNNIIGEENIIEGALRVAECHYKDPYTVDTVIELFARRPWQKRFTSLFAIKIRDLQDLDDNDVSMDNVFPFPLTLPYSIFRDREHPDVVKEVIVPCLQNIDRHLATKRI